MREHSAALVQTANMIRKGLVDALKVRAGQFIQREVGWVPRRAIGVGEPCAMAGETAAQDVGEMNRVIPRVELRLMGLIGTAREGKADRLRMPLVHSCALPPPLQHRMGRARRTTGARTPAQSELSARCSVRHYSPWCRSARCVRAADRTRWPPRCRTPPATEPAPLHRGLPPESSSP